jgi:hypothetical protein
VTRGISFLLMFLGGVLLHAAQALPFSPCLSSWPCDRQLPPRPNRSVLSPVSCCVCACPQVLSSSQCSRVDSSPVASCSPKIQMWSGSTPSKTLCLRALHTLLPETRLTLQVQYCTIDPSPRDADSSGEGRVGAGCRYAS